MVVLRTQFQKFPSFASLQRFSLAPRIDQLSRSEWPRLLANTTLSDYTPFLLMPHGQSPRSLPAKCGTLPSTFSHFYYEEWTALQRGRLAGPSLSSLQPQSLSAANRATDETVKFSVCLSGLSVWKEFTVPTEDVMKSGNVTWAYLHPSKFRMDCRVK